MSKKKESVPVIAVSVLLSEMLEQYKLFKEQAAAIRHSAEVIDDIQEVLSRYDLKVIDHVINTDYKGSSDLKTAVRVDTKDMVPVRMKTGDGYEVVTSEYIEAMERIKINRHRVKKYIESIIADNGPSAAYHMDPIKTILNQVKEEKIHDER